MPKKSTSAKPQVTEPAPETEYVPLRHRHRQRLVGVLLGAIGLGVLLVGGNDLLFAGKVYPGVSVAGTYLGGLSRAQAEAAVRARTDEYAASTIVVQYNSTGLQLNPSKLGVEYDANRAVALALGYGRSGNLATRAHEQLRALLGRPTEFAIYKLDDAKVVPYLSQIASDVTKPVVNASYSFVAGQLGVQPAQPGTRLNSGALVMTLKARLGAGSNLPIVAPVYQLAPTIDTASLAAAQAGAQGYLSAPVTLNYNGKADTLSAQQVVAWLKANRQTPLSPEVSGRPLTVLDQPGETKVSIDSAGVSAYVDQYAGKIDQPGQNAALTIQDGRATVFQPSRPGYALNRSQAVADILAALVKPAAERQVALKVTVKQPDVREDNLNSLGINELISEGFSTFPGSSQARLTNVRVGASKYNGILLAPDQVFSFGQILGDVGPEQGYLPSLVIIGTKEEKQYGGGLCQVSSTAYRAALNAGLPILERTNHAFAVEFYTQPYGTPGVDATIYYPQVDFKFKNDTGHYILIQTIMEGSTLKFDFYGTKTKTGRIRGPFFVSGSLDDKQPSHTVFYRDVLDLAGNVTKTDAVNTWYKSSTDFTIVDSTQYH